MSAALPRVLIMLSLPLAALTSRAGSAVSQPAPMPAGAVQSVTVSTNALLETLGVANFPGGIVRRGVTALGDAPDLTFVPDDATCPQNGGAGDVGSCVPAAGGGSWRVIPPSGGEDAREFGVAGNGVTDDAPAIAACAIGAAKCLLQGINSFSTTLASQAAAGSSSVVLTHVANLAIGGVIYIPDAGAGGALYLGSITGVAGTAISVVPKIGTAVSAGASVTGKSPVSYRVAKTLALPDGSDLEGTGFTAGDRPIGATIVCDLAVTPCIQKGALTTATNPGPRNSVTLRDIIQTRQSGPIPTNSIGIEEDQEQEPSIEYVYATRNDFCFYLKSTNPTARGSGFQFHGDHLWTGDCKISHFVVDGWPVVILHDLKLGYGSPDAMGSTSFFRITGGPKSHPDAGPSTLDVTQVMAFGPTPAVQTFVEFVNCPNCASTNGSIFRFDGGHVEATCHIITTDRTITNLVDFFFTNFVVFGEPNESVNCRTGSTNFFNVDPATRPFTWIITGNHLGTSGTLRPIQPIQGLVIANNVLGADAQWDITGATGSSVSCGNNLRELADQKLAVGHLRLHGGSYGAASDC
jgi:hypothetical protein